MLKKIIWILNILAALAIVLSFLASWISPARVWWIALFVLGFEILFLINLFFSLYWMAVRNKRFLLSMIFVLLGLGKISGIIQINFSSYDEPSLKEKEYIKVMSFNVRLFDLYNWFHNAETRQRI